MMTQAETGFVLNGGKGGVPSLGGMLQKNMGKVLKYKSKDAEVLAARNQITHKKSSDMDLLDDFLSKENSIVCARCSAKYDPANNFDGGCFYHPMQAKTDGSNVKNHQQSCIFPVGVPLRACFFLDYLCSSDRCFRCACSAVLQEGADWSLPRAPGGRRMLSGETHYSSGLPEGPQPSPHLGRLWRQPLGNSRFNKVWAGGGTLINVYACPEQVAPM